MRLQGIWANEADRELLRGNLRENMPLHLVPEPTNPHDRFAVKVILAGNGAHLGYVPRILSPILSRKLNDDVDYYCRVTEVKVVDDKIDHIDISLSFIGNTPRYAAQFRDSYIQPSTARGLYAIVNIDNLKFYLGSSKNILERVIDHKNQLNRGAHDCRQLQEDWNTCGAEKFVFTTFKKGNFDLEEEERKWINLYGTYLTRNGYNTSSTGVDRSGHKRDPKGRTKPRPPRDVKKATPRRENNQPGRTGSSNAWLENERKRLRERHRNGTTLGLANSEKSSSADGKSSHSNEPSLVKWLLIFIVITGLLYMFI